MSTLPKPLHLKPGAAILTAPTVAGGAAVIAKLDDCVLHPSGAGFHICCVPNGRTATVPVGGLPLGQSTDQFHWSQGASYSGQGFRHLTRPRATMLVKLDTAAMAGSAAVGRPGSQHSN
jgi:hypothetical protein